MKQTIKMSLTKLNKSLLYRYLFFKHYYKFFFLHKPLCERYKTSTLKIFGLYVCRSCLLLYIGLILGIVPLIVKLKVVNFDRFFFLGFCGLILTFAISYPSVYSRFSRPARDFIRFYDGLFLGMMFVVSFKININIGVASIILFLLIKKIYNKKRHGDRICAGCSELEKGKTCEGYIRQKQAFLDLDEEYSNIVTNKMIKQGKDLEL